VAVLLSRGVELVGPVKGELAEGEEGIGRMAEPEEILTRVEALLVGGTRASDSLSGVRVVISAGGTREPLDTVRYIGNRSSGRMGVALAEEAQRRGADVTLLAANLTVPAPPGITVVETPTAEDLEREAFTRADADVIVMAAAVADYRLLSPLATKRPKDGAPWAFELAPTTDVLAALGAARRPGQVLVGFAADGAGSGLERAREKRRAKSADLFVFNDVSRPDIGFDAPDNEVVLISEDGEREVAKAPKLVIAAAVLDEVERVLSKR
jgi:phosphopantothenoylcysteine decarboxylase/phosphopantothenate--cysteine ligase